MVDFPQALTAAQAQKAAAALGLTVLSSELPKLIEALQQAYNRGREDGFTAGYLTAKQHQGAEP